MQATWNSVSLRGPAAPARRARANAARPARLLCKKERRSGSCGMKLAALMGPPGLSRLAVGLNQLWRDYKADHGTVAMIQKRKPARRASILACSWPATSKDACVYDRDVVAFSFSQAAAATILRGMKTFVTHLESALHGTRFEAG